MRFRSSTRAPLSNTRLELRLAVISSPRLPVRLLPLRREQLGVPVRHCGSRATAFTAQWYDVIRPAGGCRLRSCLNLVAHRKLYS
eukprot:6179962-Pleurochrysis_carterae.AAC.3